MADPMRKWKQLNDKTKAALAIVPAALAVAGWLVALGATQARGDLTGIPARVQAVEGRVDNLETTVRLLGDTKLTADANAAKLDSVQADVADIKCVIKANVEGRDAQFCLSTFRGGR